MQQRGGVPARNLHGEHGFLLVFYRLTYPTAQADEVIAFIANHASRPRIYSRGDISKREIELGFTRKRGSTEANQAELPINRIKRHNFWHMTYPYGVIGTPRQSLIDSDECGIILERTNRKIGKAYCGVSVREAGKYYRNGEKWTLILAVDCSRVVGFRFKKVAGTSVDEFNSFLRDDVLVNLPLNGPRRTFMWDNLKSHLNNQVYNTIVNAGHRVLRRPPYWPSDGPIEFVFNQVQIQLTKRMYEIKNDNDLVNAMTTILTNLTGLDATFVHCGYV